MGNIRFNGIKPLQRLSDQALGLAFANPLYHLTLMGGKVSGVIPLPSDPWPGDMAHGHELMTGVYSFAGQSVASDVMLWDPVHVSDDWMAQCHGFGWLRDLRSIGGDRARLRARHLVSDWMEQYDRWHKLVWRPDIMGDRLSHWVGFYSFFGASADDAFQSRFENSVSRQLKHLERVLPGGYTGLPLVRGVKGIVYASLTLNYGPEALEAAFKIILEECAKQILPDGGYVSRSPDNLLEMLRHLLDLRSILHSRGLNVPPELQHTIDRMSPALKFFRYGDGDLAMFHGGRSVNTMLCERVLTQSGVKGRPLKSMRHSGYERMVKGKSTLMMDVGCPHPDGHVSPLAFEFSVGRERLITNCGGSPMSGAWAQALRCQAAHSTITVEDKNPIFTREQDQDDQVRVIKREEIAEAGLLEVEHSGYRKQSGLMHRRRLYLAEHGNSLTGEDVLTRLENEESAELGEGDPLTIAPVPQNYAVRFHLHPSVQVSLVRDGAEALLRSASGMGWRMRFSGDVTLNVEESVYYADGVEPRRCAQLVLVGQADHPRTIIKWQFHKESFYGG